MGCSSMPGGKVNLSHKYLLFPWPESAVKVQLVSFDFQLQEHQEFEFLNLILHFSATDIFSWTSSA